MCTTDPDALRAMPDAHVRATRDAAERLAIRYAREGAPAEQTAAAWVLWRLYAAELSRRYPPLQVAR